VEILTHPELQAKMGGGRRHHAEANHGIGLSADALGESAARGRRHMSTRLGRLLGTLSGCGAKITL